MIRVTLFNPAEGSVNRGDDSLISSWEAAEDSFIWVDIGAEQADVERALLRRFGIHELAIQDALRQRHPPKVEAFDEFVFILLKGLDAETTTVDFGVIQLALFVGERFLLTRHGKPSLSANTLHELIESRPQVMAEGPCALALRLTNRIARRYVEILLDLEPRLDEIEAEMFKDPNDKLLEELTGYKSRLRQLSRIARYHEHVAGALRRAPLGFSSEALAHELTDLYEQIERSQSLADLYYNIASDLTDGYLALSSHRLNNVMQVLTIFTVLFVPLTFLAGIYGMNFREHAGAGQSLRLFHSAGYHAGYRGHSDILFSPQEVDLTGSPA